ncbi:MAG: tetratricopeptide repeat protein [Bacteroidota bacterium]|nr:tetratricopeptide repeat protein [Bacteroidota bacterium]
MKPYLLRKICSIVFLLLGGFTVVSYSQASNVEIKIRLAQSYERSGNFEAAVKLYEEAFGKDSANVTIFESLKRSYLQLKRYDDAISLIQQWLRKIPNDIGLLAQLGSIYILNSDEASAVTIWDRAVATHPTLEATYKIVGGAMIQSRLFERAIELYKRGRTACGNPALFMSDIAYLYSIMMNYTDATREYLKMVRQNPNDLGLVQSRIAGYTTRADGISAATLAVEDAVKTDPNTVAYQQLLAWLYMEGKQFDRAYNVYKIIDEKMKADGRELYNFAERTLREKAFTVAIKAFKDIVNRYPKFAQLPQAKFGYARALEESYDLGDTLKLFGILERPAAGLKPPYSSAIESYRQVISEYPNTEIAARSLLRVSIIQQEKYFDLDGARSSLETLEKNSLRFSPILFECRLRLGNVYLSQGNLTDAANKYNALAGIGSGFNELKEQAAFRLAELDYFQERFNDALTKLQTLTTQATANVTNDALSLQIFIQENLKSNEPALRQFAKADFLKRQLKFSEALIMFESILKENPKADIADEASINIGDILTHMNKYSEAIAAYERALQEYPETIYQDRTLMKIGQIYQLGMKDKVKAIEAYQRLLEKFQNSIYSNEARKKIRELRGDSI